MRIDKLHLQNFRGFQDREFEFPERVTVLVGDNGAGKTALLDGLAVAAGALFLGLRAAWSRTIRDDDVRRVTFDRRGGRSVESQYPCRVSGEGTVAGKRIQWHRTLAGRKHRTDRAGAGVAAQDRGKAQAAGQPRGRRAAAPDRLLRHGTPHQTSKGWRPLDPGSRLTGYDHCFDPSANLHRLLRWFATREMEALQFPERAGVLKAVKKCIAACMEGWKGLRFDIGRQDSWPSWPTAGSCRSDS